MQIMTNQSGAAKTVVIVVAVALLMVAGVAVWALTRSDTDQPGGQDETTSESSNSSSVDTKAVASLVIEEWQVKLPLPKDIADATYFIHTESGAAALSTKRANDKCQSVRESGVALSEQDCHLGGIVRYPTSEPLPNAYASRQKVTIGNYHYFYAKPQTSLSQADKDETYEAYEIQTVRAFESAIKQLTSE